MFDESNLLKGIIYTESCEYYSDNIMVVTNGIVFTKNNKVIFIPFCNITRIEYDVE